MVDKLNIGVEPPSHLRRLVENSDKSLDDYMESLAKNISSRIDASLRRRIQPIGTRFKQDDMFATLAKSAFVEPPYLYSLKPVSWSDTNPRDFQWKTYQEMSVIAPDWNIEIPMEYWHPWDIGRCCEKCGSEFTAWGVGFARDNPETTERPHDSKYVRGKREESFWFFRVECSICDVMNVFIRTGKTDRDYWNFVRFEPAPERKTPESTFWSLKQKEIYLHEWAEWNRLYGAGCPVMWRFERNEFRRIYRIRDSTGENQMSNSFKRPVFMHIY